MKNKIEYLKKIINNNINQENSKRKNNLSSEFENS